jgi:hypothetical protein
MKSWLVIHKRALLIYLPILLIILVVLGGVFLFAREQQREALGKYLAEVEFTDLTAQLDSAAAALAISPEDLSLKGLGEGEQDVPIAAAPFAADVVAIFDYLDVRELSVEPKEVLRALDSLIIRMEDSTPPAQIAHEVAELHTALKGLRDELAPYSEIYNYFFDVSKIIQAYVSAARPTVAELNSANFDYTKQINAITETVASLDKLTVAAEVKKYQTTMVGDLKRLSTYWQDLRAAEQRLHAGDLGVTVPTHPAIELSQFDVTELLPSINQDSANDIVTKAQTSWQKIQHYRSSLGL